MNELGIFEKRYKVGIDYPSIKSGYLGGYVYILDCADSIKIGRSRNVNQRINTIIRQSGKHVINYFISSPCANYTQIETYLHTKYSDSRILGEWFNCDFDDVVKTLSAMKLEPLIKRNGDSGDLWQFVKEKFNVLDLDRLYWNDRYENTNQTILYGGKVLYPIEKYFSYDLRGVNGYIEQFYIDSDNRKYLVKRKAFSRYVGADGGIGVLEDIDKLEEIDYDICDWDNYTIQLCAKTA